MNATLTIMLNDLRVFFAERGNLVGLAIMPLAFTLVLGWVFGSGDSGPSRVRVDVIDRDSTPQSTHLLEQLRAANATLVLCPMDNDAEDYCRLEEEPLTEARALERARSERTQALIIIPAGYGDALLNLGRAQIEFYAAGDANLPNAVEQTVSTVLQRINTASLIAGVTGAILDNLSTQSPEDSPLGPQIDAFRDSFVRNVYEDAQRRIEQREEVVHYELARGEAGETFDGFGQSIPGMASMFVMFTVLRGMAVLLRERNQWTLQRLVVLPLSRAQILGGKVLTYFTLGMIQYLIVFAIGLLVGLDFGDRPLLLMLVMIAFTLCCTGIAFAIAPFITSEGQANGISNLLALSLAPLGGAWWPLEIVPDFMRTLGHFSPVAWAMDAFHDVLWYSGGLPAVLPEIGVLMAAAAVLFAVGVRRFRYV